jgi:hypothetical protein
MADRVWETAVHEAGHAIAGRILGLRCGGASVIEPGAHARVYVDDGAASVCVGMAGAVAETIMFGSFDAAACGIDRGRWTRRLHRLGYSEGGGGAALWRHTVALLKPHRSAIVRLATELACVGMLDGDEIDDIVARHRWPSR